MSFQTSTIQKEMERRADDLADKDSDASYEAVELPETESCFQDPVYLESDTPDDVSDDDLPPWAAFPWIPWISAVSSPDSVSVQGSWHSARSTRSLSERGDDADSKDRDDRVSSVHVSDSNTYSSNSPSPSDFSLVDKEDIWDDEEGIFVSAEVNGQPVLVNKSFAFDAGERRCVRGEREVRRLRRARRLRKARQPKPVLFRRKGQFKPARPGKHGMHE